MVPKKESLIKKAEQATGLSDFGDEWFFPNIDVFFMDGHTESQMLPVISHKEKKIVFDT